MNLSKVLLCLFVIGLSFFVSTPKPGVVGIIGVVVRVCLMLLVVAVSLARQDRSDKQSKLADERLEALCRRGLR
jgi:protein-S-isoprenylcysteine O-methyltransferase Ste14